MVDAIVLVTKYMCPCSSYKGRRTQRVLYIYYIVSWLGLAHNDEKSCVVVFYGGFRSYAHVG